MRTAALLLLLLPQIIQAQLTHTDVFRAGTGGYHSYRIPALLTASSGHLLAFAEARRDNRGDPGLGDIDLVLSRSTDQGRTWLPMQLIDDPGEKWSASNPTPLLDRTNNRLWIFYNRWMPGYGTDKSKPGQPHNQMWARFSDDHGLTWSAPRDLTRDSRDYDNWGAMFLGPGGAIQTRSGRLLLPASTKTDLFAVQATIGTFSGSLGMMRAYVMASDDHGKTWKRGALVPALTNENQLVELANGQILMDARQNDGDHRWFLTSADQGDTWLRPRRGITVTAIATAIERWGDLLVWTGPTMNNRQNLVLRISRDEGQTWPEQRLIYGGFAAYSDMAILSDASLGLLWERGETDGYQAISFTRFTKDFLSLPNR
jgi:sialidase-1